MMEPKRNIASVLMIVVVIIAIIGGGFYVYQSHHKSKADRPISSFLIENAATPGKSSSDFAQEQLVVGDTAVMKLTYNPQLLTAVAVRFVASNGTTAKTTDRTPTTSQGSIDLPVKTDGLAADIYRVEILNQNQQVVDFGELTLTAAKQ